MKDNQKGMTLVELLATLAVLAIVSALVMGLLISSNKNYKSLSSKANLSREANLITTTLKNYHEGSRNVYFLYSKPESGQAFIGETEAIIPLHNSKLDVRLFLWIQDIDGDFNSIIPMTAETEIPTDQGLKISLTVTDKTSNQSYNLETIIQRY